MCEHRTEADIEAYYAAISGVPMAAPWRTCPCCKVGYYYIDSGSWSQTSWSTNSHTLNCDYCGGGMVHAEGTYPKEN
jgi:hypothetical protein